MKSRHFRLYLCYFVYVIFYENRRPELISVCYPWFRAMMLQQGRVTHTVDEASLASSAFWLTSQIPSSNHSIIIFTLSSIHFFIRLVHNSSYKCYLHYRYRTDFIQNSIHHVVVILPLWKKSVLVMSNSLFLKLLSFRISYILGIRYLFLSNVVFQYDCCLLAS